MSALSEKQKPTQGLLIDTDWLAAGIILTIIAAIMIIVWYVIHGAREAPEAFAICAIWLISAWAFSHYAWIMRKPGALRRQQRIWWMSPVCLAMAIIWLLVALVVL